MAVGAAPNYKQQVYYRSQNTKWNFSKHVTIPHHSPYNLVLSCHTTKIQPKNYKSTVLLPWNKDTIGENVFIIIYATKHRSELLQQYVNGKLNFFFVFILFSLCLCDFSKQFVFIWQAKRRVCASSWKLVWKNFVMQVFV